MASLFLRTAKSSPLSGRLLGSTNQHINIASFSVLRSQLQALPVQTSDLKLHVRDASAKEAFKFSKSPEVLALLARLRLNFSKPELIRQVLIHNAELKNFPTNERLRYLGRKALNLYLSEFYYIKYPHLSTLTIETILQAHYDPIALSSAAQGFGMASLVKIQGGLEDPELIQEKQKVLGKAVQSLIGAIYHDKGAKDAKDFIHKYILSTEVDIAPLLPLEDPKRRLRALLKILNKEEPVARLLKETGRLSNRPIFIVGVFSGLVKLGESYGSSLKMAEFRACKDAMLRYYLNEHKDFQLPSDMEGVEDSSLAYQPVKLSDSPTRI